MDTKSHEEVLRSLFRESNDAFFLFEPASLMVIDLNPAALRLTGHDRKDALTMRVDQLFSSDDPQGVGRLIHAYRKTGVFHSREEYFLRRAEGEPLAVNLSASRIHTEPEPIGLVVARDINERRKAQVALERFFLLSPALFGILSTDGTLIKTNRAWETVLGYKAEDLRSMSVLKLVHPDDRDAARMVMLESGGEVASREVRCLHKDGSDRWLSWSASRVDNNRYLVAMDITAAREAESLRQAKESAEMASRAKGQFLSSMSHELRTPLTAMLALVDVFMADPDSQSLSDERRVDLETIHRNGQHLLGMINSVLDLARIESGKMDVKPVACHPTEIVDEVAELMKPQARDKGLRFGVNRGEHLPEVIETDPIRLRQILINLVGNAIKFTHDGEVLIRIDNVTNEPEPRLRFRVTDTGVGLSASDLMRLFEPFHQAGPSPRRVQEGTGLGLAISRRLAEALGGSLTAASKTGVGSTFDLVIPAVAPRSKPATRPDQDQASSIDASPGSGPTRVLLAEDNADNRRAIAMRLQQSGMDVTVARHGEEAVDLTLEHESRGTPFDVILMDMQMPVLDGFEATRQLRQKGYQGKIVALTAFALEEDRQECLRFGCDFHLSKPIEWGKLMDMIHDAPSASSR